jgi:hypothetical protein
MTGSIISLTESNCMSPYTNPPNATQPSDTLAHNGSPRKLDDERDRLLLLRDRLRDDLGREEDIFDKFLLNERVRFPMLRAVDLRDIFSSKIIVNLFSVEILYTKGQASCHGGNGK